LTLAFIAPAVHIVMVTDFSPWVVFFDGRIVIRKYNGFFFVSLNKEFDVRGNHGFRFAIPNVALRCRHDLHL
jgi:hypothetical protein